MENQDHFFEQFKHATAEDAPQKFADMDKVWQAIEVKLDEAYRKKTVPSWKIGMAASLLLMIGVTLFFLFKKDSPAATENIIAKMIEKRAPQIGGTTSAPKDSATAILALASSPKKTVESPVQKTTVTSHQKLGLGIDTQRVNAMAILAESVGQADTTTNPVVVAKVSGMQNHHSETVIIGTDHTSISDNRKMSNTLMSKVDGIRTAEPMSSATRNFIAQNFPNKAFINNQPDLKEKLQNQELERTAMETTINRKAKSFAARKMNGENNLPTPVTDDYIAPLTTRKNLDSLVNGTTIHLRAILALPYKEQPLYLVQGKKYSAAQVRHLLENNTLQSQYICPSESVKKYGPSAVNGAVIITIVP